MKLLHVSQNLYRTPIGKSADGKRRVGGTYYAVWWNKSTRMASLKTRDFTVAKARLRDKLDRLRAWRNHSGTDLTFQQVADRWSETVLSAQDIKPSSRKYRQQTVAAICRFFGPMPVRSITEDDCLRWKTKRKADASPQRFNNELGSLRMILRFALTPPRSWIVEDPSATLKRVEIPKTVEPTPTRDEFVRIIRTIAHGNMDAAWFLELMAYSGMRLHEAAQLRWSDIHPDRGEHGMIHVTGGERGTKNRLDRWVPIMEPLRDLLDRMRPINGQLDRVSRISSCYKALQTACENLKLPHYTHHAFRRYFAHTCIEAGATFIAVAGWLGHQDNGITLSRDYAHLRQTHSDSEAQKIKLDPIPENVLPFDNSKTPIHHHGETPLERPAVQHHNPLQTRTKGP